MIDTVPLSLLRRHFPLCPCLYSEGNFHCASVSTQKAISISVVRWSLSLISRPMIPPVSTQKGSVQNNCRSAYRQLSSRDGTYIIYCHATFTISMFQSHSPYSTFNHNSLSQYQTQHLILVLFSILSKPRS